MLVGLLFLATVFLAYTNGANDNFKGVATLVCSGVLKFKSALVLTTIMTLAGGLLSVYFADTLVNTFSGKGLMPEDFTISVEFLLAISLGAGVTVLIATLLGLPISTTHSLTGALVGAGFVAAGSQMNFSVLGSAFMLPLLISPIIAVLLSVSIYLVYKTVKNVFFTESSYGAFATETNSSECAIPVDNAQMGNTRMDNARMDNALLSDSGHPNKGMNTHETSDGDAGGGGSHAGFSLTNSVHILSAAVVCFARGLHDTPKIIALIVIIEWLNIEAGIYVIAISMAVGGVLSIKKVATTLGQKVTTLEPNQGVIANLVTGFLVLFASKLGVPVSTTHVSVGAMAGIGLLVGTANTRVLRTIGLSWCLTLPISAALAAIIYLVIG
ncbi:MAG: anion permease [Ectothiorhodospiraceae bacterium]|nr:anion permease [Ectothiorhodospiraceae bacterium]